VLEEGSLYKSKEGLIEEVIIEEVELNINELT
jgi:hypothetical protein